MSTQSAHIAIIDEDLTRHDRGCLGCRERWKWSQRKSGRCRGIGGRRSDWQIPTVVV